MVRMLTARFGMKSLIVCALMAWGGSVVAQNPPSSHVIIPNPTPRPPDLKQEYGDNPKDQKKREAQLLQSRMRSREIWLESNEIMLLAQQLQEAVHPGKKAVNMATNAVKAGQIEKLAQSVQQNMKVQ